MKITVLADNLSCGECQGEWGLSIYIDNGNCSFLLDMGATDLFAKNAQKLGIDLSTVDYGVLSHAHYDHADGMSAFFEENNRASLHLREACKENCYSKKYTGFKYIGIHQGFLNKYSARLKYVSGCYKLADNAYLLGHSRSEIKSRGIKSKQFIKKGETFFPELFEHEQSLIFVRNEGLIIFNSCSHAGVENIIAEAIEAFPRKRIIAYVGGLHLYRSSEADIYAYARRLSSLEIEKLITGHCTGDIAYGILEEIFPNKVHRMYSGMSMEI